MKGFSRILASFTWINGCEQNFPELKQTFTSSPVFMIADTWKLFLVYCYTSYNGMLIKTCVPPEWWCKDKYTFHAHIVLYAWA